MGVMTWHGETIAAPMRQLLTELMATPELAAFRLVGGTALALHLGHRKSVDIDLFSCDPFSSEMVGESLASTFALSQVTYRENTLLCQINGIKVDLIAHRYPWVSPPVEHDGVRLASLEDIAAMKLNAIANRGSKKDFWDVAALLDRFSCDELQGLYQRRYPHMDLWQATRSLLYFDDAEAEPDPISLTGTTWADVKNRITASCHEILP
jgi:hypothetical protein